jgi:hypothetical protein
MGDGILAFFGAPLAHEDDAQRAVLAGLGILESMQPFRAEVRQEYGLELDMRVGINSGTVVVGDFGTDRTFEYTAMGDAVNIAARMEQTAAPGTVQITDETYRLVYPYFTVDSLGLIAVKGKDQPVDAYRVTGRQAQVGGARYMRRSLGVPLSCSCSPMPPSRHCVGRVASTRWLAKPGWARAGYSTSCAASGCGYRLTEKLRTCSRTGLSPSRARRRTG